jgi:hypothetical protein
MTEHANFRQRLDAVLRTRDVQQVSAFLLAENQWSPGVPADPDLAMWLMIAGSPALKDLHAGARQWLIDHGHAAEAEAILNRGQSTSRRDGRRSSGSSKKPGPR